jgi:hypothetical protein
MVEHSEFDATDWVHLHVISLANERLREFLTSSKVSG